MLSGQPRNPIADALSREKNEGRSSHLNKEAAIEDVLPKLQPSTQSLSKFTQQVEAASSQKLPLREINATSFLHLAFESHTTLVGAATANLESGSSLAFFPEGKPIASENQLAVPLLRIRRVELLSDRPLANTPLSMPSVWPVRLDLHPLRNKRASLDTTFEP